MITGKQARETMNAIREADSAQVFDLLRHLQSNAVDYVTALAWLYGREADDEAVWDDHYEVSITADKRVAVFDHDATTTYFTPDEAIEFARALIAAAEQARHE